MRGDTTEQYDDTVTKTVDEITAQEGDITHSQIEANETQNSIELKSKTTQRQSTLDVTAQQHNDEPSQPSVEHQEQPEEADQQLNRSPSEKAHDKFEQIAKTYIDQ